MPIELEGSNFMLSIVHLHDVNPEVVRQALEDRIAQAPAFLRHAPMVVNIVSVEEETEWCAINETTATTDLRTMGVSECKIPHLKIEIDRAGILLLTEGKEKASYPAPPEPTPPPSPVANQITKAHLVDQPVRSGRRIYVPRCDLIVTDHVSAGTEPITDDNIHVYGMMRECVLASAGSDRNAQIFCTHLTAEPVSIAGEY